MINVEAQAASALGIPAGRIAIRSSRSIYEKQPWRGLEGLSGVVETEFVRPSLNGENIFPFRVSGAALVVLPCGRNGPLSDEAIELNPGLHQWWQQADDIWEANKRTQGMSLMGRVDYQSNLSKQFPIPEIRVVYNRAGMHIVSAKVTDRRAVIANGLYWASVRSHAEADFLCAILNAPITTELARPYMSYGKDERDIHKAPWELPIPPFDEDNPLHARLSALGAAAEGLVSSYMIEPDVHFPTMRGLVRDFLSDTDVGRETNETVYELIS